MLCKVFYNYTYSQPADKCVLWKSYETTKTDAVHSYEVSCFTIIKHKTTDVKIYIKNLYTNI